MLLLFCATRWTGGVRGVEDKKSADAGKDVVDPLSALTGGADGASGADPLSGGLANGVGGLADDPLSALLGRY